MTGPASPVDLVLDRLERPKRNGAGWIARCPAHDDGTASLTVSEGDDGRALLHCHAGCQFADIVKAFDLKPADLFPPKAKTNGNKSEISATYPYCAADGTLLYEVVRFMPKDFRQRRPDGNGGGIWNLHGVTRVLYRLPQVLDAIDAGQLVWITEGEKDADALVRASEVATCNPGGALKWRPEYAESLRGALVCIVADKDEPGYKHARQVAASLEGVADSVTVVEALEGKDAADHLAAGFTAMEFVEVDLETPTVHVAPARTGRLVQGGSFILDLPAEPEAIWGAGDKVLWSRGEPLLIVGPQGVGKTTLAAQLIAARLGLLDATLLGYDVQPARRILYIAGDRPAQIGRAMRRLFTEADRAVLDDRLVVWKGPPPVDFGKVPERLLEMCVDADADCTVLDSYKDMTARLTDDESASNLNRAIQNCVAEDVDVAGLHHQRKGQNGQQPKTLEDVYGSVWVSAGQGSVLLLWGAAGDPLIELKHLKQPASEVGPLRILHDAYTGRSYVETKEVDAVAVLRNAGDLGVTARDLATTTTGKATPSDNDRRKAGRELDRLVRAGLARRTDTSKGGAGGTAPARFYATAWGVE